MSDKNIEVIKHIQDTGKCPEDDIMATSVYSESGYQPKAGNRYTPKKSIDTNPPPIPTKGSSAVPPTKKVGIEIDYSNNLFDPNEKDPVMRALNMVKEYCNTSIREINQGRAISTDCFKADAYQDVIDFVEEHQKKCHDVKSYSSLDLDKLIEQTDNSYIKHLENEIEWFKGRMDDYKNSFFMVCDLVKNSNVPDSVKYFVEREEKRY